MFNRLMVGLVAMGKRSKWLFGRKKLPSPEFFDYLIKDNF